MGEAEAGLAVVPGTRLTDRIGVGVLTRLIDRDLVDDVLAETGRVEQRSRLLPARVVVYYVLGLCLFFGEAYEEVMRLLVAGLRFTGAWQRDWQVPATGAIAQARQRLGAGPLRLLFERVAVPCAQRGTRGAWLGPRRLMAIDGFVLGNWIGGAARFCRGLWHMPRLGAGAGAGAGSVGAVGMRVVICCDRVPGDA